MQFIHRYVFAVGFANIKRYDMIALYLQTVPKAHYNLAKPIITLNSPQAIITAHLLYGRCAKAAFSLDLLNLRGRGAVPPCGRACAASRQIRRRLFEARVDLGNEGFGRQKGI